MLPCGAPSRPRGQAPYLSPRKAPAMVPPVKEASTLPIEMPLGKKGGTVFSSGPASSSFPYLGLMALTGHTSAQAAQPIHFSSSTTCFSLSLPEMAWTGHTFAHWVQPMHLSASI